MENSHLQENKNRLETAIIFIVIFGLIVLISYLQWIGKL